MEVDAATYPRHLLGLLVNISEADFVSFDLELTGIPSRLPGKEPWKPRAGGRKTLKDRYEETKEAANRYNILQVGITCARFDYLADKYILRPYNIAISPLLDERLDIEREICIQSGAATFLLNNGFDLGAAFAKGVQYLSRNDADRAKQMAYDRLDKKNVVQDVQLKVEDVESLDFVRRTREAITAWRVTQSGMLEITSHTGFEEQPILPTISRFEKRLVHQLVRAEFPDLVAMGRATSIRIIRYDEDREADNTRRLKNRAKESIAKQTGFRWVFEALAQGDIHEVDPFHFGVSTSNHIIAVDTPSVKDRFDRARERLRSHQPVLVGHNMFTDLVYFYRTFVGPLPDTLEEFRDAIHELFPRIVDTKYLATHAGGDLNASPTLQEIAEKLEKQPLPDIATASHHDKYENKQAFHEAGFDSLLTATIMIRLSAKLNAERQAKAIPPVESDSDHSYKTAREDEVFADVAQMAKAAPLPLPAIENLHISTPLSSKNQRRKQKSRKTSKPPPESRFQTRNIFESLRQNVDSEQEDTTSSEEEKQSQSVQASSKQRTTNASWEDDIYQPDTSAEVPIETVTRDRMELIPAFDAEFWGEFGNTLRIFGTQEGVLRVGGWEG
ncbi:CAF1-domain-containing protein [Lentithecium fluviatile CBS 122367]|uniref:CAF1-domain-containing protein n=1 Tax=Lentithecium fluviatile CBS 122367 TaxID=1168545 RepID=A0A6G1J7B9_9PLEO|nr:CAF1-domain-containing protein [Lentithecium fluviatile CBS 122367]